jgi:hypothetical protein
VTALGWAPLAVTAVVMTGLGFFFGVFLHRLRRGLRSLRRR